MITNIILGTVLLIAIVLLLRQQAKKHKLIPGDKRYVVPNISDGGDSIEFENSLTMNLGPKTEETNSEQIN